MQTALVTLDNNTDIEWRRAAYRECLAYNEHGRDTETRDGRSVCFNCGGNL